MFVVKTTEPGINFEVERILKNNEVLKSKIKDIKEFLKGSYIIVKTMPIKLLFVVFIVRKRFLQAPPLCQTVMRPFVKLLPKERFIPLVEILKILFVFDNRFFEYLFENEFHLLLDLIF